MWTAMWDGQQNRPYLDCASSGIRAIVTDTASDELEVEWIDSWKGGELRLGGRKRTGTRRNVLYEQNIHTRMESHYRTESVLRRE